MREEAAKICSAKASDCAAGKDLTSIYFYSNDNDAIELARLAFLAAPQDIFPVNEQLEWCFAWAEAEAMIHCGWTPQGYK